MSLDLIEIALDQFTDWERFEDLASEIMRDEGYPDIKPLGGIHDAGQDAVVERFFLSEGRRLRVVFQFTLRSDVAAKIQETIKRLDTSGTTYQKLVIVTPIRISTERQQTVKKQVKLENQLDLEIYERKTLVNRLADPNNDIFLRYFPDIREQVNRLLQPHPRALQAREEREKEFLKVSYAFTFAPGARRTRKSLIDEAVLAILSILGAASMTAEQVIRAAREAVGAEVLADLPQVVASLERLVRRGHVERKPDGFCISPMERVRLEAAQATLKANQASVVSDIVADVCNAAGELIADTTRAQLEENARDVLAEYFRMNGIELAQSFLSNEKPVLVYFQGTPRLLDMAKRRVRAYWGDLLAAAIGKALCAPTAEQAHYFAGCSRAYLALHVMNLDPSLREFQGARFATKVFVLDTDIVLGCIIQDLPISGAYRNLVSRLVGLGAKVLVPEEVLAEVATHVEIAPRTYAYFGAGLLGLNEELASTRIGNLVVRGYWYRSRERGWGSKDDFLRYRENYFEASEPRNFVRHVVREMLPGVTMEGIGDFLGIDLAESALEPARSVMFELAERSEMSQYRTEEQTRRVANHDTRLMLAVASYNAASRDTPRAVLGGRAYIITSSGRYLRAGERLKLDIRVSTRPHILLALFEMIGEAPLDDRQFVALFENSLLQQVVAACWDDVKVLLDAGLELRDKEITRLRYDVERRLNAQIYGLRQADAAAGDADDADPEAGDREHIALLEKAESLGYRPVRWLAKLREEGKLKDTQIARLAAENEELREAVKRFGKKKARWLRRMERRGPRE